MLFDDGYCSKYKGGRCCVDEMSLDCTICEDYQTTGVILGCPPNLRYYQKFLDQGPYSCCDQVLNPDETNIPDILSPELCYE